MDCIFCQIAAGEIPSNKVYEDDVIVAFHDIQPVAPVHVVVIPKKHICSGAQGVNTENCDVIAHIFKTIPVITEKLGVSDGFRVVTNNGAAAGQSVEHIHFHIVGGKELGSFA